MYGIFGGTFDPIHFGHLRSALEVLEHFGLDEIKLIPSKRPPHKPQPLASETHRLEMLKLAVYNQPAFVIEDCELKRKSASYTVDTLDFLRNENPDEPFLLFIGTDGFNQIKSWFHWERLFELAHVVVLTRPGHPVTERDSYFSQLLTNDISELAAAKAGKLYFLTVTALDISASNIREMIKSGKSPQYLLPEVVWAYIKAHQLYDMPPPVKVVKKEQDEAGQTENLKT